jgi:hypothetical protein
MKRRKRQRRGAARSPLEIVQILDWADAFHRRVGRWPTGKDGKITGQLGLTWTAVDVALMQGHRGLRPGSSLAKLLCEHRGKVHRNYLPRFSVKQILAWADAHHKRSGAWPVRLSGPVRERPRDTWTIVDKALRNGGRGLKGGSSLARLLARHRGVRNHSGLPPLTIEQILAWADAHRRRTGAWPQRNSGPIPNAPAQETWAEVSESLRLGRRTLPRLGSLAQLLAQRRGVRNVKDLARLKIHNILAWARAHHERTGKWPTYLSGPVLDAPGETWGAIHRALYAGGRGFPGGSSLYQVIRPLREEA